MLSIRWLGRVPFEDAFALQEEIVARKAADLSLPDELLLLEHEPVYTIGRTPDQSSLRAPGRACRSALICRTPSSRSIVVGKPPTMARDNSSVTRCSTCGRGGRICIVTCVGSKRS